MNARAYGQALFALLGLGTADLVALNAWAIPGVLAVDAARPRPRAPRPAAARGGAEGAGGSVAPETDYNAITAVPGEPVAAAPAANVTPDRAAQPVPTEPAPKLARDPALVLFHKGTWWVGPASRRALRDAHPRIVRSQIVELEGHADRTGSNEINQRISAKRANAVEALLIRAGIDAGRIRVRAFGETQASGTALDRRVEIWIEP